MAFIRFSTRDYPKADRLDVSRDVYSAMAQVDLEVPRGEVPEADARIRLLPGVSLIFFECSTLAARRSALQADDGSDDISLLLNPGGGAGGWVSHQRHLGSEVIPAGSGCICYTDLPGGVDFHGPRARFLNVAFSRSLLSPMLADLDRRARDCLPPGEAMHFLMHQALDLLRSPTTLRPEDTTQATEQLLDMATLALGGTPDATAKATTRGLSAARLRAIKADLAAHAGHGGVSLGWVAKRYAISPSYVRALFERDGTSFTDYLLELRLQRVFSQLSRRSHSRRSVADLAYAAGFNNLSWFYRAFKRRFDMTPSDVHKTAVIRRGT